MLLTWVMATSWSASDQFGSTLGSRFAVPLLGAVAVSTAQQPQPQIRMPLKRSSATSMKRTRCRFRLQLDLRPQLQCPRSAGCRFVRSPNLAPSFSVWGCRQIWATFRWIFRQIVAAADAQKKLNEIKMEYKKTDKSDPRAILDLFDGVCPTKPVWPINTSITTQLLSALRTHGHGPRHSGWSRRTIS